MSLYYESAGDDFFNDDVRFDEKQLKLRDAIMEIYDVRKSTATQILTIIWNIVVISRNEYIQGNQVRLNIVNPLYDERRE